MKFASKPLVGMVAASALVAGSATPALADDRNRHRGEGISAGEVIAGAVILGGIAAVIASSRGGRDDYDRRDRHYDDEYDDRGGYGRHNARFAVDQCVRTAEREAERYSGERAEVYEVSRIERERGGFEVRGRIAVRNDDRGHGWRNEYRRGNRNNGWDEGRFTCEWRGGSVADLDFSGIRSL